MVHRKTSAEGSRRSATSARTYRSSILLDQSLPHPPEPIPEPGSHRIAFRKTGHHRSKMWPLTRTRDQTGPHGVFKDVTCHGPNGIRPLLVLPQDVVIGLLLQLVRGRARVTQDWIEMLSKELARLALIGVRPDPHPQQMNVVRHETIGRTKNVVTRGSVEQRFTEAEMKLPGQPAFSTRIDGHRPMDRGVAAIRSRGEPLQIRMARRPRWHVRRIGKHVEEREGCRAKAQGTKRGAGTWAEGSRPSATRRDPE